MWPTVWVVSIDRDSPEPIYRQLAGLLRDQIRAGTLTARLPSVRTLTQEHDVSHITAARALEVLKDEGLVTSSPGKGYFVARD